MKTLRLTVLAAVLAALTSQAAFAQAPGTPGAPGSPDAAGAAPAGDSGVITNATTTTTTTTTAPTAGVPIEAEIVDGVEMDATLTNTGGAPLLMSLAGLALAGSAFAIRRKVS